jgi:hypothetical protein
VAGPPVPPQAEPGPTEDRPEEKRELTPEERHERRQNRWLIALTVVAVAAAGAAGYAISEVEDAKDENREGSQAVNSLRADLEVFREQTTERLDALESQTQNIADASTQRKLQDDLDALEKKVNQLDQQSGGGSGEIQQQLDDLEQRVDDLENESN